MSELLTVESQKTAGFINPNHVNANRDRVQKEEEELEELIKANAEGAEPEEELAEAPAEDREEMVEVSGEERTFKKRYSDLRTHSNKQVEEIKYLKEQLDSVVNAPVLRPPKSDEEISEWADQYPDVAAIVETIATKKAQEKFDEADARLHEIDKITAEASRVKLENKIRESHLDFDTLRDSDEFHDWAGEQPKWVQDALYENSDDPASVVRVIDLYKIDHGMELTAKKAAIKKAAKVVATKRGAKPSTDSTAAHIRESQVHAMTPTEYAANAETIDEAIRTGKFVYDMSGGAR
jgi:hypothetical protein